MLALTLLLKTEVNLDSFLNARTTVSPVKVSEATEKIFVGQVIIFLKCKKKKSNKSLL